MLNIKEQIKSAEMETIQQEPLFTELTPEAAAIVEGGYKYFDENVDFDYYRSTKSFYVRPGKNVSVYTNVSSASSNPDFKVAVRNVNSGRSTPAKTVSIVKNKWVWTGWTNMRGGNYKIDFVDTKDGVNVKGAIRVFYDWDK
jgi:hypothetical protein